MRPWLLTLSLLLGCEADKSEHSGEVEETGSPEIDQDGDGFPESEDCDDTSATIYPGATESCNELDDDCDGEVDESAGGTWYADADGDGYGDPETTAEDCSGGDGWIAEAGDCDDSDPYTNPEGTELCDGYDNDCDGEADEDAADAVTMYLDADGDGYGDPGSGMTGCEFPESYCPDDTDCDDADADINPGASETCDLADNDCDGEIDEDDAVDAGTWYADADGDGYGDASEPFISCEAPAGTVADSDDCDDAEAEVHPDADELCNTVDDDCDGEIDEDEAVDAGTWYTDADGDGYGDPGTGEVSCTQPEGTSDNDQDCDDADDAVNPDAEEVCNGLDDDCDGQTDDEDAPVSGTTTWYADADEDGYGDPGETWESCEAPDGYLDAAGDCDDSDGGVSPDGVESWYDAVDGDCDGVLDPDVCESLPDEANIDADADCVGTWGTSWSLAVEWTTDSSSYYAAGNSYDQVMVTPVVGNLNDDNGDGLIDDGDVPDVVYTSFKDSSYNAAGYLRVVSGDGSGDWLNVYSLSTSSGTVYISGDGGVALGDLEGDGSPDIVTMSSGGDVIALENDGTLKWLYDLDGTQSWYPAVADLDGDGLAEVVVAGTVLSSTGALVGACAYSNSVPAVADIDLDGETEILMGNAVCDKDGGLVWASTIDAGFVGVANVDDDDYPEIVNVYRTDGLMTVLDDDGTELWSVTLTGGGGGPPAAGDLDGDGEQEIAVAGNSRIAVYEADGTVKWRATIDDSSSQSAGCSVYDFDADGAMEVLYADENAFYIFDGASGSKLYSTTSHQSGTIREYPLVADVDRDGHAEVVLASNDYSASGWTGIHVLGESNGAWPSARFVWNQHAYEIESIDEDLSFTGVSGGWASWDTFRGQKPWGETLGGAPDLSPLILGACEDCGSAGEVDFYVVLDNAGAHFVPEGLDISLYAVSSTGSRKLLDSTTTEEPLDPGVRSAPFRFTVSLGDLSSAAGGVVVVVDEDDVYQECDETNNEDTWDEGECF